MKYYLLLATMICAMFSATSVLADRGDRFVYRIDNRVDRFAHPYNRPSVRIIVNDNRHRAVRRSIRQANRFDRYNRRATRPFVNSYYYNGFSVLNQGNRIYNGYNRYDRRFNRRLIRQNNRCVRR